MKDLRINDIIRPTQEYSIEDNAFFSDIRDKVGYDIDYTEFVGVVTEISEKGALYIDWINSPALFNGVINDNMRPCWYSQEDMQLIGNSNEGFINDIELIYGNCLRVMKIIPDKSIGMILCDLPYGQLNRSNKNAMWDVVIPFEPLWEQYERIIKDNGVIVLFAQGMFTARLMISNPKMWRYNLIWQKGGRCSGFLNAKRQPLREHEDICVFYKKQPTYNPQMTKCLSHQRNHSRGKMEKEQTNRCYGKFGKASDIITDLKYPRSILNFKRPHPQIHPTQKPVRLLEYLIKTYTNEGDTVLDNCMGSGSCGVGAVNTNRKFIGIELDENYFNIAKQRIDEAIKKKEEKTLFD